MPRCRFNRKLHCGYEKCDPKCETLIKGGQQMLLQSLSKEVEVKKRKGHTVKYYKVEK